MRAELQQSNQRERSFLKLLKKTEQYRAQATELEAQYDYHFTKDGLSKDPQIGGAGAQTETKSGGPIPKLNLSIIYMQQDAQGRSNEESELSVGGESEVELMPKKGNKSA